MANLVKKHSISSELAQRMVDAAVAKAREIGVSENVAILDDGGDVKAFGRMALFAVSTQDFSTFSKPTRHFLGGGVPIKVDGELVGAIGLSGAPTVENDVECARAALALVPDAVGGD